MEAAPLRALLLGAEAVAHHFGLHASGGAQLGHLFEFEEVVVRTRCRSTCVGVHIEDLARCGAQVAEALARGEPTYGRVGAGVTLFDGVIHDGAGVLGETKDRSVGLVGCGGDAADGGQDGWERNGWRQNGWERGGWRRDGWRGDGWRRGGGV